MATVHKEDGREEGSKPISTSDLSLHMVGTTSSKGEHKRRAFWMLLVPIIIISAVVVVVVVISGVGTIVHMSQQINSLQKQVNDLMHSRTQHTSIMATECVRVTSGVV